MAKKGFYFNKEEFYHGILYNFLLGEEKGEEDNILCKL